MSSTAAGVTRTSPTTHALLEEAPGWVCAILLTSMFCPAGLVRRVALFAVLHASASPSISAAAGHVPVLCPDDPVCKRCSLIGAGRRDVLVTAVSPRWEKARVSRPAESRPVGKLGHNNLDEAPAEDPVALDLQGRPSRHRVMKTCFPRGWAYHPAGCSTGAFGGMAERLTDCH